MPNEPTPNTAGGTEYVRDHPAPAIAPEGLPIVVGFVLGSTVLTGLLSWLAGWRLGPHTGQLTGSLVGLVTGLLTIWCVWFFRDPKRRIPKSRAGAATLVSPADGVICFVGAALPPEELGLGEDDKRGLTRVSVFMNVFNVHVNRAPAAGVVEKIAYRPGKFFNASFDKASSDNERSSIVLRMEDGRKLVCVQIAGLIARRIVCRVREGARLETGERYGLIRFGSRVDVYLPRGVEPMVAVGQRSVAGETVLAMLPKAEAGLPRAAVPGAQAVSA
jgi:phosphatidylserine decarboxylase